MAILDREQYLAKLKNLVGDSTDDESLSLLEDMTDTYNDLQGQIDESGSWKSKYEENDAAWRKRYAERFMSGDDADTGFKPPKEDPPEPATFESLFKEG